MFTLIYQTNRTSLVKTKKLAEALKQADLSQYLAHEV